MDPFSAPVGFKTVACSSPKSDVNIQTRDMPASDYDRMQFLFEDTRGCRTNDEKKQFT